MDEAARAVSAAAGASCSKATRPRAASTRTWATAWPPPASSTTCRCSSKRPPPSSTTSASRPPSCCTATWNRPSSASGRTRRTATAWCKGDPERPALPPESLFLSMEQFYARANAHAQLSDPPRRSKTSPTTPSRRSWATCRWCAAPKTRSGRLQGHIRNTAQRVLLLAESDGRRESLLDFLRASGLNPPAFDSLAEFQTSDEKVGIATSVLTVGLQSTRSKTASTSSPKPSCSPPARPRRRKKKQEQVSDVDALIKDLSELNVGDPVVHSAHGIGRYRGLVNLDMGDKNPDGTPALLEFLHLEYADKAVLYVPVSQLQPDRPLHRRERRRSAAAQAGQRPVGKGQAQGGRAGARRRRRTAEHLRPPRRAPGPRLPLLGAGLRDLRQRLRLRRNRRPEGRHPRRDPGHDQPATHGPPGLRRRGLRQDRGGIARGLRGRDRRQAGGLPGAHHAAGRAALPDPGGPLRQVAGEDRRDEPLPLGRKRSPRR